VTDDELKRLLQSGATETRRHFDVTAERLEKRFDGLAEMIAAIDEKYDRRIAQLEQRMQEGFAETQR